MKNNMDAFDKKTILEFLDTWDIAKKSCNQDASMLRKGDDNTSLPGRSSVLALWLGWLASSFGRYDLIILINGGCVYDLITVFAF